MDVSVVMLNGTTHRLTVDPRDTVGSLKDMISKQMGVLPVRQRLVLDSGGQNKTLSDDSWSLSSFGVQSGCRISLLLLPEPATIQVMLKNQAGNLSKYDVKPDETVTGLKQKVQAREGVQASQQRLLHQSREMMDGSRLSDYSVKDQSTIELMLHLRGG